ncbi:MAG: DUF4011 domain-containing protein [Treponema sp.]|nr:DUF4011 domain-containing protein [Treponema sp.]
MGKLDAKIDFWKSRLLDLGRKNRLINCPPSFDASSEKVRVSRNSIGVKEPDIFTLWKIFVDDEKPLSFPSDEESTKKKSAGLITNQTLADTQKTLRHLKQKARSFSEEKGLNSLFLAFFFLIWQEKSSKDMMRSPILLVPAKLSQEKIISPYILNPHDDEITANQALSARLQNDFGISLPVYNADMDLKEYFEQIKKICEQKKWQIDYDVELSLFSFLKINMYKDIEVNSAVIKSHPVIKAIAGESAADVTSNSAGINLDHDSIDPQVVFNVIDADSSQHDAILLAKKGVSFILQGPPGTGKSQTITNIIAELLAQGKRVLFVAEKMAAVEVVHKRLSQAGLSPFCFTLHNHNIKRREVFDQIEKSLDFASKDASLLTKEIERKFLQLKKQRGQLNAYVSELHTNVEPLDCTIFYANGKIASLEKYPDISFNIENASGVTSSQYSEFLSLLDELSRIIESSGYQKDNPWKGYINQDIDLKFRQDFSVDSKKMITAANSGLKLFDEINELFGSNKSRSAEDFSFITDILSHAAASPGVPSSWIKLSVTEIIDNLTQFELNCRKKDELVNTLNELDDQINNKIEELKNLDIQINEQKCNTAKFKSEWETEKNKFKDEYDEEIFEIDAEDVYRRYRADYRSTLGKLNPGYLINNKKIFTCLKRKSKISFDETLVLLEQLTSAQKIRIEYENQNKTLNDINENINFLNNLLAEIINKRDETDGLLKETENALRTYSVKLESSLGITIDSNSDYKALRDKLEWTQKLSNLIQNEDIFDIYLENVCSRDEKTVYKSKELLLVIGEWTKASLPLLNDFASMFEQREEIIKRPLKELSCHITSCAGDFTALEHYTDYRKIKNKFDELRITEFFEQIEEKEPGYDELKGAFEKHFYRVWLDAVIDKYPTVKDFRGHNHEDLIISFRNNDKLHLEISRDSLLSALIKRLPSLNTCVSEHDEIGLLKREMKKQRKLMSARKLIASLPNVLQILKPCMMLSPLSVSTYLSASNFSFDTVIFDEASQIRTEDAICSLFRAKQAIITGDSKQLPPTDFFGVSMSSQDEEYEEDADDSGAFDSLLDEASLLPSKMLSWHYRSCHEDLIVFSNKKIYNGNLTTFPSSIEKADDTGVQYIHVPNGIYDRGGRRGNQAEAEKTAQLVFEHFLKYPKRSLGIIAFGETQQSAITDAVIKMRKENHDYESFFNDDDNESFFIKNLETVQGDERDTIIFSIGYAPDAEGKFIMNFGPLSRDGGERRLNVAVTRARHNIKLVGSIQPGDIDPAKVSGDGPKLLKLYIDFAINGPTVLMNEVSDNTSSWQKDQFEASIYNFLTDNGFDVQSKVGCSGYRIDLAVRHPSKEGCYAIGIECDGESYSSARSSRERDRLRHAVLENMGWSMYRVWSADWIKDPKNEGAKLLEAVKKAVSDYGKASQTVPNQKNEFLKISERLQAPVKMARPKFYGSEPKDVPVTNFEDEMLKFITNSYGIHKDGLFKEAAQRYGWDKLTPVIKDHFEQAYQNLIKRKKILERDIEGKISVTAV